VFFGSGYISVKEWWTVGFMISVVQLILWNSIGALWWKAIGLW
jgi:DASS family divalent anion:Na+ symporter